MSNQEFMTIGFTGTRRGMTAAQNAKLISVLNDMIVIEFHHGSCEGADVEAAVIAASHQTRPLIICHPGPDNDPHRTVSGVDNETLPGKSHFARNRDIVNACDLLLATPCDMKEQETGGTWYTIRYCRKLGKRSWIIWPDGTLTRETAGVDEDKVRQSREAFARGEYQTAEEILQELDKNANVD